MRSFSIANGFDLYIQKRKKESINKLRSEFNSLSKEEQDFYNQQAHDRLVNANQDLKYCCIISTLVLAIGLLLFMIL